MSDKKIFYGGSIVTMNDSYPLAEAVGIEGEKIVAVGTFNTVKNKIITAKLIDLKGKTLLPGFHDAHCHPIGYLFFLINLNLGNIKNYNEFLTTLKETVKLRKPGEWIFALNYNELNFKDLKERKLSNRWELDKICPNNPTLVLRFDGHIAVVNSKALEVSGIDSNSKPPEGSEYRKDEKGELTGIITEKAVMSFLSKFALPSKEQINEAATRAFNNLASKGITTVHGIISMSAGGESGDLGAIEIPVMKSIQGIILQNWYSLVHTKEPEKIKKIKKPPLDGGKEDSKFKVGCVKLYIDGSLGGSTAWMHEPFSDAPNSCGLCVYNDLEDLYNQMKVAHNLGYQIGVHAIGDKGNRVLVDLYKRLLNEYPRKNHRHRIEHASLLTPDVIQDIKELGLIASIQPPFVTTDSKLADYRLGKERSKYTYPFKSLVDAGVVIASGSDCPVEDPSVIMGLYAAVTRGGWTPEESITMEDALKSYTINAAYAAFEENVKGSIEVGKLADLVVLDKNPLEVSKEKIKEIQVLETIIRGKSVYKKTN